MECLSNETNSHEEPVLYVDGLEEKDSYEDEDDGIEIPVVFEITDRIADPSEYRELLRSIEEIIEKTKGIKLHSALDKVFRPFIKTLFSDDTPENTQENKMKAEEMMKHIQALYDFRARKQNDIEAGVGYLINHVNAIRSLLPVDELGKLEIVIYGFENTGKSTLINTLTGYDISFTDVRQATKCPVRIHVYRKDSGETEFYFNATIALPGQSLSQSDMKLAMARHMEALPAVVPEVLNIAVYSTNPIIEGIIVDTPGVKQGSLSPEHVEEKNNIYKLLKSILEVNHEHSVFICTEVNTNDGSQRSTSFETTVDHFEKNFPEMLPGLLQRTSVVVNKINFQVSEATLQWKHSSNEAFHNINKNLLSLMKKAYGKFASNINKPIFLGINHQNLFKDSFSRPLDSSTLDSLFKRHLDQITDREPYKHSFDTGGMTSLTKFIQEKRMKVINQLMDNVDQYLTKFMEEQKENRNNKFYNIDIFDALNVGHGRFLDMLRAYAAGYYSNQKGSVEFLSIPVDDAPKLADYLMSPLSDDSEKDIFDVIDSAEYRIRNVDFKRTSNLEQAFEDAFQTYGNGVVRDEIHRNGVNEVQTLIIRVLSEILSLQLENLDQGRCMRQATNARDIVVDEIPKIAIERQVMEDFLHFADIILKYLEDTLYWYFEKVVDAVLLVDRLQKPDARGIHVLDVDGAVTQYRSRINMAFKSWIEEIIKSIKVQVTQGTSYNIFDSLSFSFASVASLLDLKIYEFIDLTAKDSNFSKLLTATKGMASDELRTLGQSNDAVNIHMMNSFFGSKPDIGYTFDPRDYHAKVNKDYGKKFFGHLMRNLSEKINVALKTKIEFFANDDERSSKSLRNKMRAYVFHSVGSPKLTSIEETNTEKYNYLTPELSAKFALPPRGATQVEVLKEMYHWDEKYAHHVTLPSLLAKELRVFMKKHPYFKSRMESSRRQSAHTVRIQRGQKTRSNPRPKEGGVSNQRSTNLHRSAVFPSGNFRRELRFEDDDRNQEDEVHEEVGREENKLDEQFEEQKGNYQ